MTVVNFYRELGIEPSSDLDAISTAIRENRRRYRQLAGSPKLEQRSLAEQKIKMLAEAEKRLSDPNSRAAYDEELRRQPAHVPVPQSTSKSSTWIESAQSYLANGQARNAAAAAKEATRAQPESIEAWKVRAYAALELQDFQDAEFSASEAQRRSPSDATVSGLLGDVYDAEERYADAEKAYSHAASIDTKNPHWPVRVAQTIHDQGRTKEAEEYAHAVLFKYPGNTEAKTTYAVMLLQAIESALSTDHDGSYITNKNQIAFVEARMGTVQELSSADEDLAVAYNEISQLLVQAKSRRFVWPGRDFFVLVGVFVVFGTWILGWIITAIFGEFIGGWLWLAANIGLAWYTITKVLRRPQWYINQKALGPYAKTGLQ